MGAAVEVVAGVLTDAAGRFLLAQRPDGKAYAGYWEFPGGKVEPGESPEQALARELAEELGIAIDAAAPWIVREHRYPHAHVRLRFFRIRGWRGEPQSRESQRLAWQRLPDLDVGPMLPANGPVLRALALPPVYGITHAARIGVRTQLAALDRAFARGLRLLQLREPSLDPAAFDELARETVRRARVHGARVLVSRDVALARAVGADGVHLSAADLARCRVRPALAVVGASCHARAELEHAAALGLDFALLGPVRETPTHPGIRGIGWGRFRELARELPMPVYGIGGLAEPDLPDAIEAGAHGVAAIRSVWGD